MVVITKTFPTDFTTKSNPVDADILLIADSEDGNEMKKITVGSITADIGDGLIVDASASTTTTYSSDKINTLNSTQDTAIGLKLTRAGQLRTGNWAWKTIYNDASGNETELTLWAATRVMTSNGATAAPSWEVPTTDIVSLTEDTAWDMDADFLLAYDNSATANRKQKANVYRATAQEAIDGTATNKFITPLQLSEKIAISTSDVTVTNTTTETTLVTQSIAANALTTGRAIRFRIKLTAQWTTNGSYLDYFVKFGGTQLMTVRIDPSGTPSQTMSAILEWVIIGAGSSSQEANAIFTSFGTTDPVPVFTVLSGTSSIDSTSAQTFLVTAQWQNASADLTTTMQNYIISKV